MHSQKGKTYGIWLFAFSKTLMKAVEVYLFWTNSSEIKNFALIFVFKIFIGVWLQMAKYIKISCNFRMIIMKLNYIFTPLLFFALCEVELKNTLSVHLCLNRHISWINSFLFTQKCRKWTFSFWTKICIFCNKPHIFLQILIKVLKIMLSL